MCSCATSRTNSHATVWYPLFTGGMSTTLLPECLTPMLLLTFWPHWMVYIRVWSLQWNFLLRIRSRSLVFRSLRMGQNLKLVFTESRPTPVYSYIFKAMLTNVTKPFYWRPCCIVPMPSCPCHLRQKPLMRNAQSCALYSPDLIILLASYLKPKEIKPSIVNRQCVVYKFACDLCDADYVGYTARHLHQRIAEHKYSSIGKHLLEAHGDKNLLNEGQFRVLKKCHGKFDCLVIHPRTAIHPRTEA